MSNSRIPESAADFNNYVADTNTRLLAVNADTSNPYWTDFNFTSAEKTSWGDELAAWLLLYPLYASPTTSTSIVKDQVRNFIRDFATFAMPLLDKIVASGLANEADEHIFHIVLERSDPTFHNTPIPETCIPALEAEVAGVFDIRCKSALDQSRPSIPIHSGANSVQYVYVIGAATIGTFDPDASTTIKGIATKSHFQIDLGTSASGQWLHIMCRWYNTHHPALAGEWSTTQTAVIR